MLTAVRKEKINKAEEYIFDKVMGAGVVDTLYCTFPRSSPQGESLARVGQILPEHVNARPNHISRVNT